LREDPQSLISELRRTSILSEETPGSNTRRLGPTGLLVLKPQKSRTFKRPYLMLAFKPLCA
jgi:hypothetical protein